MNPYNLITSKNNVAPKYDIRNNDITFEIYISHEEDVCILGALDNNYICWCSITKSTEKDTNAEIMNHLLSNPHEGLYSTPYKVLDTRYNEIKRWHHFTLSKAWYNDHYRYRSPVSHCFFGNPPYNNGLFIANEIQRFIQNERRKCQYRLIDDGYVSILCSYKTILMKESSPEYYHQMLPIIDILNREDYLKLCPNEEVRALYGECLDQCSHLYNLYMTASR